jgi:RNA polymerase sigma-70 factor (ECF subfamily)
VKSSNSFSLEQTLQRELPRLVRLCAHLSGSSQAADDLAQETLIEAWRNAHKLVEPAGYAPWLSAIARNVCRRWARQRGRTLARFVPSAIATETLAGWPDSASDNLAWELEQADLARLLELAMHQLPSQTRQVLMRRYLEEASLKEVAAQLGITENVASVRLHRGKQTLRKILATQMRQMVNDYGLLISNESTWQDTRIWCPRCGQQRLLGRFSKAEFTLRCPHCALTADDWITHYTPPGTLFEGVKTFKPALSRALASGRDYYQPALSNGQTTCYNCGAEATIKRHLPAYAPATRYGQRGMHTLCSNCQAKNYGTLDQFALSLPQVQKFWRQHPRMRLLPEKEISIENLPGLLIRVESVTTAASVAVLLDETTYEVRGVHLD